MAGLMEGKVVVVTGAGGGVGREIAIMMAGAGAKVIIADIGASLSGEGGSASPAEQTKALIEQKGGLAEICTESVAAWGSGVPASFPSLPATSSSRRSVRNSA